MKKIALLGYGVIGKRVADATALQDDMELIGVCDVISDWRIKAAVNKGFAIYAATNEAKSYMEHAGIPLSGNREDLLNEADLVVDCTPKKQQLKMRKSIKP